jgi:Flp pilus assembly protein protease CpaA
MQGPFFPDHYFAWTFYAVLVGMCLLGAYIDLRKAKLPKSLTLIALALGFVFNIVRGAWLGSEGHPLVLRWLELPTGSMGMGALHGFLFSLVGFVLTTILFTMLWALRTCGGGDVKLFAALGAWVGFLHAIFIMLASVLVLVAMLIVRLVTGSLKPMAVKKRIKESQVIQGGPGKGKWKMTYAFPVAVGTAVLLLWFYRVDLHLAAPKADPNAPQVEHHGD